MKILSSAGAGVAGLGLVITFASSGVTNASPQRVFGVLLRQANPPAVRRPMIRKGNTSTPAPCATDYPGGASFVGVSGAGDISGGAYSAVLGGYLNSACDVESAVGGGYDNRAGTGSGAADQSCIGAGAENTVTGFNSFIGAGLMNGVSAQGSFIGAGGSTKGNSISGEDSAIGAGDEHTISQKQSFIGAGISDSVTGVGSFAGAGEYNAVAALYGFVGAGEYSRAGFDLITDVAARDPYSATIRLKRPYGSFYELFFSSQNTPLLPKHLLGALPDINTAPYNALPVGAGPFKYVSWKRNEAVEMIANDRFYRGRPKLNRVIYRIVTDWNTVESLLRTGEIDMGWLVPGNIVDRLATIPGFTRVGQPSALRTQLQFNTASPPLRDLVVRQALRLATDRATLLRKVEHEPGYLSEAALGPLVTDAVSISAEPYDPKRAAAMLEAAGWIAGADGVRAKNGVRLAIDIATITGNPERDTWAVLIQSWWSAIGVRANVKHYPPSVLFGAYAASGIFTRGDYTASIDQQSYGVSGASNALIFACNQFPPAGFNVVRYCDPKLDALMERLDASYDPAFRKATLASIQRTIADAAPIVTLFFPSDNFVYNADLRNVGSFANLDDAYRWSM